MKIIICLRIICSEIHSNYVIIYSDKWHLLNEQKAILWTASSLFAV